MFPMLSFVFWISHPVALMTREEERDEVARKLLILHTWFWESGKTHLLCYESRRCPCGLINIWLTVQIGRGFCCFFFCSQKENKAINNNIFNKEIKWWMILCILRKAWGSPYYHKRKQIFLGKMRTENCVSNAKSYNAQEDKLRVLLQSTAALPPQRCIYWRTTMKKMLQNAVSWHPDSNISQFLRQGSQKGKEWNKYL